jgi:hypothetical protein
MMMTTIRRFDCDNIGLNTAVQASIGGLPELVFSTYRAFVK